MLKNIFLYLLIFFSFCNICSAENNNGYIENIQTTINDKIIYGLNDNDYETKTIINKNEKVKILSNENFSHLYIIYATETKKGILYYNEKTQNVGNNNFLHEYIKLDNETNEIIIEYEDNIEIKEIYLFNKEIPTWVQTWSISENQTDLLLFSTYVKDINTIYAGLIPSLINSNKNIQIFFLTHEDNTSKILNELWELGIKNYPIIGLIPEDDSDSLDNAINILSNYNQTLDNLIKEYTETIRHYTPYVIVSHDETDSSLNGQQLLNEHILKKALEQTTNKEYITDSDAYTPSKIYLHSYPENKIQMNYNTPLETYNNQTAYEVSKNLFLKYHPNETYDINSYTPSKLGLYYSANEYDIVDDDLFHNIEIYDISDKAIYKAYETLEKVTDSITYGDVKSLFFIAVIAYVAIKFLKDNKKTK